MKSNPTEIPLPANSREVHFANRDDAETRGVMGNLRRNHPGWSEERIREVVGAVLYPVRRKLIPDKPRELTKEQKREATAVRELAKKLRKKFVGATADSRTEALAKVKRMSEGARKKVWAQAKKYAEARPEVVNGAYANHGSE